MQPTSGTTKSKKDIDDESNGKKGYLIDSSGVPILSLSKSRQHSYGSCEEAPLGRFTESEAPVIHKKRHQIGSEVLDFGESPAAWTNAITQRASKRTSHRAASSFLPGIDGPSTPTSTGKRGFFRSLGSDTRYGNLEGLPPTSMGLIRALSKRSITSNKGKTILSLFGLDGSMAETHANPGTELGVLTNKAGRPRANADASFQIPPGSDAKSQLCACPRPSLEMDAVRSRIVSWSRYLDEISRIGANRASVASDPTPDDQLTAAVDLSLATGGEYKAQVIPNRSIRLPMQEENPWQICESTTADSRMTLGDSNNNPELTESIQPSTRVGLDLGEVSSTPKVLDTYNQDAEAVPATTAPQDGFREDIHGTTTAEQPRPTAKPTTSPSPKRTTSNTSTKFRSTSKPRAQSRDRKPFLVPGLAETRQIPEASALVRGASRTKRVVSKQRG